MKKRPIAVTIIGWLLVLVGAAGSVYNFRMVGLHHVFHGGNVWIFVVEVIALVCGIFLLRGKNWARWLALAWMGFHVGFSFLVSWSQGTMHAVILLILAYFLFRSDAQVYFRQG
jgi:hypothetical protein